MRLLVLLLALLSGKLAAEPLRVAVAANFRTTLESIADAYREETGVELKLSSASTGVLYSQALFGAPFDLLLAADSQRPALLVESGHALDDSLTTYALGKLVLAYSAGLADKEENADIPVLLASQGLTLAMANPELAPYGRAAMEVLARAPLEASSRTLTAPNVGQAFQMWFSGGADLALVAASYRPQPGLEIPANWYRPIAQQAVILAGSNREQGARDFLDFLSGPTSQAIILAAGYDVPGRESAHE